MVWRNRLISRLPWGTFYTSVAAEDDIRYPHLYLAAAAEQQNVVYEIHGFPVYPRRLLHQAIIAYPSAAAKVAIPLQFHGHE